MSEIDIKTHEQIKKVFSDAIKEGVKKINNGTALTDGEIMERGIKRTKKLLEDLGLDEENSNE